MSVAAIRRATESSLELILPFLGDVGPYVTNPNITELMVNGDGRVFIDSDNGLQPVPERVQAVHLELACKRIARSIGEEIGADRPLLDATLPDGSRVSIQFPPASVGGPNLCIRKFRPNWFTLDELAENGFIDGSVACQLDLWIQQRKSVLVSGGTGSGKTTLAKALIDRIQPLERLGIIEDTLEIMVNPADHPNVFRLVARRGIDDVPPVTIGDLVRASLRNRPDRLIIGEVRGSEAFDLLDALNTGHAGSLSTVHANSGRQALKRLASLAQRACIDVPYAAIQQDIGDLIDIVVHVARYPDGARRVASVDLVEGFDGNAGNWFVRSVWPYTDGESF